MKTDPPKPRMSPQGLHRGGTQAREMSRDDAGSVAAGDGGSVSQRLQPKTRLAIATFLSRDHLVEAIDELDRAGFGGDQVSIVGLDQTLKVLAPLAASKPGSLLADLYHTTASAEPSLMYTGDGFVLVVSGPLWQAIGGTESSIDRGSDGGRIVVGAWMDPATRTELTRLISAGAFVLAVSADTVDQQRRSARILLSHSSHRVQTHEFTPVKS